MSEAAINIADRRQYIGGGDAACIAGLDRFKQPFRLYMEKRGEWSEEDLSDNDAVHFGNVYEDVVATEWARRNGQRVRRDNIGKVHPDLPWCAGHIDRKVEGVNEGLECKNRAWFVAREYGPSGTDEAYSADIAQCQHYMAVTGWDRWHVAVYFGGADFRQYTIERDQSFIDQLLALEAEFWEDVQAGRPPAFDPDHRTTGELLRTLYPGTDGGVVTLPESALQWHAVAQEASEAEKRYGAVKDGARTHLLELLRDGAVGLLPDGSGGGWTRKFIQPKSGPVSVTPAQAALAAKALAALAGSDESLGKRDQQAITDLVQSLATFRINPRLDLRFSNKPKGVPTNE